MNNNMETAHSDECRYYSRIPAAGLAITREQG